MTIAVLCAIAVGSLGGSLAAIRMHPTPPDTHKAAATATPAPAATTPSGSTRASAATGSAPTTAQPHAPDPQAVLVIQMRAVLERISEWSHRHVGEPCPDATTLGIAALDPWGHPIELTCTDQPADQVMGAISAGPDGIAGDSDDVKSWNLGPSVTQLVHGSRWPTRPATAKPTTRGRPSSERGTTIPRTPPARSSTSPKEPAASTATPNRATPSTPPPAPLDAGDDIPTRR